MTDTRPVIPAWTDYPFEELGDTPDQLAPIRRCGILEYNGDKYVTVAISGMTLTVKSGYVYVRKGRQGEVPPFNQCYLHNVLNNREQQPVDSFEDKEQAVVSHLQEETFLRVLQNGCDKAGFEDGELVVIQGEVSYSLGLCETTSQPLIVTDLREEAMSLLSEDQQRILGVHPDQQEDY